MKRFLSLTIAVVFCFVLVTPCFISYAYTGGMIFSNLPEPVPDKYTKIFLLCPSESAFNNNNIPPVLYVFHAPNISATVDFDVQWSIDAENHWYWWVHFYDNSSHTNVNNYFYLFQYNAISGSFINSSTWSGKSNYNYQTALTNSSMPYYQAYGVTLDLDSTNISGTIPSLATPYWTFAATNNWLSTIVNTSLATIHNDLVSANGNLDSIESAFDNANTSLDTIESQISDIKTNTINIMADQVANWYAYLQQVNVIKGYIDQVESNQSAILNSINSHCDYIQDQLYYIYHRIDDIYKLLGGGEEITTLPSESQLHSDVDEHNSREQGYMDSFEGNVTNMNNVFNDINGHMSGLALSFRFVRDLFDSFITNISLPYIILIFSLAFGLLVTIIGRKVG